MKFMRRSSNGEDRMEITWQMLRTSNAVRYAIFGIFFVMLVVISFYISSANELTIKSGDICPENITAPTRIVDTDMTEALKVQAADMTSPVYDYISAAHSKVTESLDSIRGIISSTYGEYTQDINAEYYNSICSVELTADEYAYLINADGNIKNVFINALERIISVIYEGEVKSSEIDMVKLRANNMLGDYGLTDEARAIAAKILDHIIAPNMILNVSATEIAREAARESVYEIIYEAGQTIVNKGEIVTEHQIKLLKDNGLISAALFENLTSTFGVPGILLICVFLLAMFLKLYHESFFEDNKYLFMLILMISLTIVTSKLLSSFSVYLIPTSMLTICVSLMFGSDFAVQLNVFAVCFLSLTLRLDIDSCIYLLISGYIGIIYKNKIKRRNDLFKSGFYICLANVVMVLLLSFMRSNISERTINNVVFAIGNGFISSVGASAFMMLYEEIFNIATPFILLEMSGANDIAMQNLITKAPGTYYHSIMVGNLAESAATVIGANALLARVGAYYHDIGKADKAMYYMENQGGEVNPHDLITADTSAKIIKNHVSDGLFSAEKNKLPEEITEFIRTHHGTSELTYFKVKAEEEGYNGDEDFHYHCKLPHTKETSLVMLADTVEAAARTLDDHSIENIRSLIDKLVHKKIHEGQLTESTLTFEDVEKVKECFAEVLNNIYHSRIKYPGQDSGEENADSGENRNE